MPHGLSAGFKNQNPSKSTFHTAQKHYARGAVQMSMPQGVHKKRKKRMDDD